jgi:putative nucleotidyltransferase with HDIG domain
MGERHYDILFIDVNLPDGSGLSLTQGGTDERQIIIVMTGSDDLQTAIQAIRAGASDFILKPFSVGDFLSRFDKAREQWQTREKLERYARALETLVHIRSEAVLRSSQRFEEVRDMTVASLGAALNLKDHETADHCARVSENSVRLGRLLELSDFELQNLRWGAYLHDMGKIGIPESILLKPGELSPGERAEMEKHPLMGYAVLRRIEFLAHSTDVVLSHHERYDGTGYPYRLQGTGIPLNARIFAVLDALDAMTSRRPYREPLAFSTAARELERMVGTQFDPEILEVFLRSPASTWMVQETPVGKESAN